jgi:hypothetical protein
MIHGGLKKRGPLVLVLMIAAWTCFASDDARDSTSPYGVLAFFAWNHDWNGYFYDQDSKIERDARLMREAGIRFVRLDFLWADLEPSQGQFDFARYDRTVDLIQRQGIKILGILQYNPLWEDGAWNRAPNAANYVRYAQAVVRHFKGRVKYWEIWNEPDQRTYWDPQDDMTAYSALLKSVYPVIKTEDPTSRVLIGGLSDGIPFKLRRIYQKAGPGYFDLINIHPFTDPLAPGAINRLRGVYVSVMRVMEEFGDGDKPIWFTEIGCPGAAESVASTGWWLGRSPSEDRQAEWVATVYETALQWKGVQKIFWAFFRDTGHHFGNGIDHFGLVREDASPKPAYFAFQKLSSKPREQDRAAHP